MAGRARCSSRSRRAGRASAPLVAYLSEVHRALADATGTLDATGLVRALQMIGLRLATRDIHLPTLLQHLSPVAPPPQSHGVDRATFVRLVRWVQHGVARRMLDDGLMLTTSALRHGALSEPHSAPSGGATSARTSPTCHARRARPSPAASSSLASSSLAC